MEEKVTENTFNRYHLFRPELLAERVSVALRDVGRTVRMLIQEVEQQADALSELVRQRHFRHGCVVVVAVAAQADDVAERLGKIESRIRLRPLLRVLPPLGPGRRPVCTLLIVGS